MRHQHCTTREAGAVPMGMKAWTAEVDPDGKVRDKTLERDRKLEDMKGILEFVNALSPGRVMDAGCGLGFFLSAVHPKHETYGCDIDPWAVTQARLNAPKARIWVQDLNVCAPLVSCAARPPVWPYLDCLVAYHVIEHLLCPDRFIGIAAAALRPGGWLIVGTPDFGCAAAKRWGARFRLLHDPGHISLFTREGLHDLLRDHGLHVERVETPYFDTPHFTRENLDRLFDLQRVSPPFAGNIIEVYATREGP